MTIQKASQSDLSTVAALALELWPGHTSEDLAAEFSGLLADQACAVFLLSEGPQAVGFAQCQLRYDYVEGTDSSPVGYLEGIFVREADRCRGFAKELLTACEGWAREQGCTEFASDCELDNHTSLAFHLNVGFTEANRIICFTKKLA